MRLFALHSSRSFGERIAMALDSSLDAHEEREFEDGEHKIRPLVSVRDEDAYVIHSLYNDEKESVNDKLCKLLFFIATLKDAGAKRVTAIVPYLCYARKDRRTKARDPVTMRYVASLFEAVNVDRIVTIDVHSLQAFQNAFRCKTEHLEAQKLFVAYFQSVIKTPEKVVVMSPDIGGVKRAEQFRDRLSGALSMEIDFAFMEKLRSKGVVSGGTVVGDVKDKIVIVLDDLINSGVTLSRAAAECSRRGASAVYAVATHGAFIEKANIAFREKALNKVIVTNTVSVDTLSEVSKEKLVVLDTSYFFAEVIRRLHTGGSLVTLMELE
ncbi:MAG TPA: ribose-phosphate diphosphokinase [Cyclobacteriaceae bacterium]|nr:ribose-phosphate diphosphokinase [Cyclobacteriaceae bacterium]